MPNDIYYVQFNMYNDEPDGKTEMVMPCSWMKLHVIGGLA